MTVCPKCKVKGLYQETRSFGIYERHVRCYSFGFLHVQGTSFDSAKAQVNRRAMDAELVRRLKNSVRVEGASA